MVWKQGWVSIKPWGKVQADMVSAWGNCIPPSLVPEGIGVEGKAFKKSMLPQAAGVGIVMLYKSVLY